ncbi:MAG: hypothetical protein ACRD12_01450 [Acidimicrobiales bacterium]
MTRSPARKIALLAALGAAALIPGLAASAADPVTFTKPVNATKANLDPGRLLSSPAFAVDPADPTRIVAGYADLRSRRCGMLRSADAGQTWAIAEGSPAEASYPFCSQSQGGVIQAPVAFGRDGTVYMALNGWDDQDGSRPGGAILLARTNDLGNTWETQVAYNARGKTGEQAESPRPVQSLAVDRTSGSADIVYITFGISRPGFTTPNAVPTSPVVAVSRDGGRTFDAPVDLAAGRFESQAIRDQALAAVTTTVPAAGATTTSTTIPAAGSKGATPNQAANFGGASGRNGLEARVDAKGTAYVMWRSGTANIANSPPAALFISKSTDGGRTWAPSMSLPFSYDTPNARYAISPEGTLHMAYQRNPQPSVNSLGEVYHRASTDGGKTWSEPKVLSDDDPNHLFGQFFPNISVAPNGRIDVVWWDTRDDPGIRSNDVYYAYSTDNGATWSANTRITDQVVDRRFGVWGINYDINSPPGVGSADEFAVFGWDDTRFSRGDAGAVETADPVAEGEGFGGGVQDVFISAAQFAPIATGSSDAAKIVLAAVVGLLIVGVALVVAATISRRRVGGGPPSRTVKGKESATVT